MGSSMVERPVRKNGGNIKKDLKLSDRIYKCECGNIIDRDYQAAWTLKRYGAMVLEQSVV